MSLGDQTMTGTLLTALFDTGPPGAYSFGRWRLGVAGRRGGSAMAVRSAGSPQVDDAQLITRVAAGDALAMQVLYARYHLRIYRFLVRLTGNTASAEELLGDVFLDLWRDAGRFEQRSSLATFLCAMARNKALAIRRRRSDAAYDEDKASLIADEADTPEVTAQKSDKSRALRTCIAALSPEHREVIDLVYYQEMSVSEVSRVLGVAENTVKTRMFYARKRLSEMLRDAGIERGWP
jgi:RNA polymerase sigma-70 factor (ECF subfamily)